MLFRSMPTPENPALRHHRIETLKAFSVHGYGVTAIPVPHGVPGVGYSISDGKTELFYTGDTGEGMGTFWKYVAPRAILTEVTYENAAADKAATAAHITPKMLGESMAAFKSLRGFFPRIFVTHINPESEATVRKDLKELAAQTGLDITVPGHDSAVTI